jgi:hypothetical protein
MRDLVGVKFLVGQIGTGKAAARFLQDVGNNKDIEKVVHVSSGKPQSPFAALHGPDMSIPTYLLN